MTNVSLVIFTCEGREHLLRESFQSFSAACSFQFDQVILAIDGIIDGEVIKEIKPDLVINGMTRKGYVVSIKNALVNIKTEYFFWLEDDWSFHTKVDLSCHIGLLEQHPDWVEIVYSKYGPLPDEFKVTPLGNKLYLNINGYSTNPSVNRTVFIKDGFEQMEYAEKKDGQREIGFENFLTAYFDRKDIKYVIIDPVDHLPIAHEGYLESTPRNWHMISSLEKKTEKHLLIFNEPSLARRLYMVFKLARACIELGFRQLWRNDIYEICFRIVALNITTKDHADETPGNNDRNR